MKLLRGWRSWLLLLALLALWEIGARLWPQPALIVPPPSLVALTVIQNAGTFADDLRHTLIEAAAGFAIANALALLLAAMFVLSRRAEDSLYNVAVTLHSIPFIAIMPFLVIWLGSGYAPKITVAALASFFPTLVNATRGLRATDDQAMEMMHVLHASSAQTFFKIRLPWSLPYIFAAFKISAPAAVLGATIGEWIGSQTGLGWRVLSAMFNFDAALLWATMVVMALAALAGFGIFSALERFTTAGWSDLAAEEAIE